MTIQRGKVSMGRKRARSYKQCSEIFSLHLLRSIRNQNKLVLVIRFKFPLSGLMVYCGGGRKRARLVGGKARAVERGETSLYVTGASCSEPATVPADNLW